MATLSGTWKMSQKFKGQEKSYSFDVIFSEDGTLVVQGLLHLDIGFFGVYELVENNIVMTIRHNSFDLPFGLFGLFNTITLYQGSSEDNKFNGKALGGKLSSGKVTPTAGTWSMERI